MPELELFHYAPGEQSGGPGKTHLKRVPPHKRYSIDMLTRQLQFKGTLSLSLSLSLYVSFFCSFIPVSRCPFLYLGLIRSAPTKVYIKMVKSALTPKGRSRVVRKDHSQSSPPRVLSMSAPVHTSLREIPLERDTESDGEQAEISLNDSKYLMKCNLNKSIILILVLNLYRSDS